MNSYVNMVVRNVRYRYPMSSQSMTDQLDEVYDSLTDLLGYQNTSGVIVVSGFLRSTIGIVEAERSRCFGSSASGYAYSYTVASGYMDSLMCSGNMLSSELSGMWNNPWLVW